MPASAIATLTSASSRASSIDVESLLRRDLHRDLVVQARRRAQARRAVVGPEDADVRLVGGALASACRRRRRRGASLRRTPRRTRRCRCAGGGGTRNWSAGRSTNGFTSPQCAPSASGDRLIGSWRQSPGVVAGNVVDAERAAPRAASRRRRAARGSPPRRARRGRRRSAAAAASRRAARGRRRAARRSSPPATDTARRACRAPPARSRRCIEVSGVVALDARVALVAARRAR